MTRQEPHPDFSIKPARNLALLLCLGMLAGVLIWAKLRLVTDIPRSAYAEPEERQGSDPQADPATAPGTDSGRASGPESRDPEGAICAHPGGCVDGEACEADDPNPRPASENASEKAADEPDR